MKSYTSLKTARFAPNTHIMVRGDFNIPLRDGIITDDFKLQKTLPTINYLLEQKCQITLLSHFGRPKPTDDYTFSPEYSLAPVAEWFQQHGYNFLLHDSLQKPSTSPLKLIENLRFWSGEKERLSSFAVELKNNATVFVHDAFGSIQNSDASLTLLPILFPLESRYAGLLLDEELLFFNVFFSKAQGKCLLIVSGSKIDKLEHVYNIITTNNPIPDTIVIGGKLTEYFITHQPIAQKIEAMCTEKNITLIIPTDGIFNDNSAQVITPENILHLVDLGPASTQRICERIAHTSYVIANCVVGKRRDATQKIIRALAQSSALTAITGGESAQEAHRSNFTSRIHFISTGGGAVLALMAHLKNFNALPSLHVLTEE